MAPEEFEPAVPMSRLRTGHAAAMAATQPWPEKIEFGLPGYLTHFRSEHVSPHRSGQNLKGALPLPTNL